MRSKRVPVGQEPAVKTILLAETDAGAREMLALELREEGYLVITLEDGRALYEYLELSESGGKICPDLIVSDVELAGFGGRGGCPMILLANESADSWEEAERFGAAHVLDKPVNLDELHDAVSCYLEED